MKWKNIEVGSACYYVTGTITEWLPLLSVTEIRRRVCDDIKVALDTYNASLPAFVIMPTHVHLLVYLPEDGLLHKFNKLWRGRSGRQIPQILDGIGDKDSLAILAAHANGRCRYATWKEQVRTLAISDAQKLFGKVNYIHVNPVRRGLVSHPGDWPYSSFQYYETGGDVCLPVTALEP